MTTFDLGEAVDDALDAGADGFLQASDSGAADRRDPHGLRRTR